jgi:DNA-binding NarL/FixJ family response regulator
MARTKPKAVSNESPIGSPLPMAPALWDEVAASLKFSPQQKRIVACILRGFQDKQIAAELGLSVPTVRTYLDRVFQKADVSDRMQLVLQLFALTQQTQSVEQRHLA